MDEDIIIYEQPLNERIRLFLRLEYLFQQAAWTLRGESDWDSRATLGNLTDVLEIVSRSDVKTELLKYLDRLQGTLSRLQDSAAVDREQLDHILGQLEENQQRLFKTSGQLLQEMRQHHMISAILQRKTVAAGTSPFDLPIYHHWLQGPAEQRINQLQNWFDELTIIRKPIVLVLQLIRTSTEAVTTIAENGFFQTALDTSRDIQLVRVTVPRGLACFAEISGGKHRISVRFLNDQHAERPVQTDENISFQLSCCAL